MKRLKEKFEQREQTIGSRLTFSDPAVAEMMAQSGFDWLAVDMEHSALSISQLQGLIRAIDLCGIPALPSRKWLVTLQSSDKLIN